MPTIIDIFKAIISGAIEGLTEFIPVSSTAHLLIFSWVADFNSIENNLFEIIIQFGAILAVCVIYRQKLISVLRNIHSQKSRNFLLNLVISFLPAAFIGLALHDFIKTVLFSPIVISLALIFGGVIMILIDSKPRESKINDIDDINFKQALALGFYQTLAIIPGVSRSGATIMGAILLKINRKTAAQFSFFMSIIVIFAASFFDLYKNYSTIDLSNIYLILVGFISAFISAMLVIKWFINYISKNNFVIFGIYRIVIGAILLFFIL